MSTEKKRKTYTCHICDYNTTKTTDYERHCQTMKHKFNTNATISNTSNKNATYVCQNCNKEYKDRTGLWRHKKKCCIINNEDSDSETLVDNNEEFNGIPSNIQMVIADIQSDVQSMLADKELMMALIKDNADFKAMLMKIFENGTNHMSHSHNHTNSHNKTFNLQFFLNETCKNAMNIDEFVSSIQPTLEDLEHVGKVGYAEGISSIIIKKLHEVGLTQRPIHCSDIKRKVMYVKSDDVWQKEVENKTLLVSAIKQVAKDNIDNILVWQKANPGCTDADSRLNKKYLNMIMNSMSGSSEDEAQKNLNKIIARVSNSVPVSKILQVPT